MMGSAGAWVDNIYMCGESASSVAMCLGLVARFLECNWQLSIKEGSREILACRGHGEVEAVAELCVAGQRWPIAEVMHVLGHRISNTGSSWPCWRATTRRLILAQFWSRLGRKRRLVTPRVWARCVNAIGRGVLLQRAPRWPASRELIRRVDRFQRMLVSSVVRVQVAAESRSVALRRRARQVAALVGSHRWSDAWYSSQRAWGLHVERQCACG